MRIKTEQPLFGTNKDCKLSYHFLLFYIFNSDFCPWVLLVPGRGVIWCWLSCRRLLTSKEMFLGIHSKEDLKMSYKRAKSLDPIKTLGSDQSQLFMTRHNATHKSAYYTTSARWELLLQKIKIMEAHTQFLEDCDRNTADNVDDINIGEEMKSLSSSVDEFRRRNSRIKSFSPDWRNQLWSLKTKNCFIWKAMITHG